MDETDPAPISDFASFYDVAQNSEQLEEKDVSPSLHAVAQISTRYESAQFIAKGGMKQVFKVYDARCKRDVAMATLHDDAPQELCDPLIHEAWLTAQLDHPNIITIHDVGVDSKNRPYFTMDLKSGDSLSELLEKLHAGDAEVCSRYARKELLQMFVKVCDAIAYAHSIQVLHFDLKPANIQVGHYGEVLVCDWGLGRVYGREDGIEFERLLLNSDLLSSNTLFGELRGTPGYMAPEQIHQDRNRDTRTDIYQLGCILYSILTLQRPVEGELDGTLEKAVKGEITPPRQRSPERNIPASLEAVALKSMAVDPEHRYQSVTLLGDEVSRYLTGFATHAEQAGVLTQLGFLFHRNKRFCLTVLCSSLVLLCGSTWSYWTLAEKERIATEARVRVEQTLRLYEAGVDELNKLSVQNAESVERAVIAKHLAGDEVISEKLLLAALDAEPDNRVYLRAMGEHYFIVQRFNQAAKYLDRGEKRNDADQLICDLAHLYAKKKRDDERRLSVRQVVELLQSITDLNGLEARILVNDQKYRFGPNQRAAIIEEYLRSMNPNWNDRQFEYRFKLGRLRIGGTGLERLSATGSILAGLYPKHVDISGTEIRELWKEAGIAIEKLDVRGCPIEDPAVFRRLIHLRELIIQPGQFTQEQLSILPVWVEVTEEEGYTRATKDPSEA